MLNIQQKTGKSVPFGNETVQYTYLYSQSPAKLMAQVRIKLVDQRC